MSFRSLFIVGLSLAVLAGCGDARKAEAERLGFSSVQEMQKVHAKGWHTNAQYVADETERARRQGFTTMDELHRADLAGVETKEAYDRYVAEVDKQNAEFMKRKEQDDAAKAASTIASASASNAAPKRELGTEEERDLAWSARSFVSSSCRWIQPAGGDVSMSQMKRLFGEQKVNEWCDCAYSTMSAKYSNLDLANAPDAGDLDERATAIKREIYLATAQCMDKSSVPARGSAIKTDFASLLRATVKMDKAWTQ